MYKTLIVEDDPVIAEAIAGQLESWGYQTDRIRDFRRVMEEFGEFAPHMVLMDITLPFFNGYHWCSEIRKTSPVPILFISSASDNMNLIMAVQMGGDDFLTKPFSLEVLTAKVQALIRRTYDFDMGAGRLEHRGARLDTGAMKLEYRDTVLDLTKNEFKILQTLLEKKGRVVSREQLMTKLWETDCYVDENTLTVNINRLRKKLDGVGLEDFITTKKGAGYLIC